MSDTTAAPQHKQERSFGVELARTSALSAAANAAGIAGVIGGLVLVTKLSSRWSSKSDDNTVTMDTEPTES